MYASRSRRSHGALWPQLSTSSEPNTGASAVDAKRLDSIAPA
jgi:hypothetical protein